MTDSTKKNKGGNTSWFLMAALLTAASLIVLTSNPSDDVSISDASPQTDPTIVQEEITNESSSVNREPKTNPERASSDATEVTRDPVHSLEADGSINEQEITATLDDALRLLDEGSIQEARKSLEKILENDPNNAEALHTLGRIYLDAMDDPEAARAYFERAVHLSPDSEELISDLLSIFQRQGDLASGMEFLSAIPEWKRKGGAVDLGIASALLQEGRLDESIDYYQQALKKGDIDNVSANNQLADAYLQTDQPAAAIETLNRAIAEEPDLQRQKDLTLSLAIVHYEDAGPQKAIEVLTGLVKEHPEDEEVKELLGMMIQIQNDESLNVSFRQTP